MILALHPPALVAALALFMAATAGAAEPARPSGAALPVPPPPFAGTVGPSLQSSVPAFPPMVTAPAGAPNVLLVLTDDVGFAASSTFGGPVPTPHLDRLAARGLRYTRFHTTAMCSPTRAALLTGRNSHAVSTGALIDLATGFPGYWTIIPKSAATVAEVLRLNGYNTAFFGKHHNVPVWQNSAAGPFDMWPTGLGFEYFYGFIGGDVNQWEPVLYRGISRAERPAAGPSGGEPVLVDRQLAEDAVSWIHNQKAAAPDKPFFLYWAPGSAHAPHQAPADWIGRFRGRFDQGWDRMREESFRRQKQAGLLPRDTRLTPRPAEIPAWDSLPPDTRRLYARYMEVFAAMLAYQDAQIGRVLDELARMGQLDNTLVMFIQGDNGASAEGGPTGTPNELASMANGIRQDGAWLQRTLDRQGGPGSYQLFPVGWAWATNAPFQWTKQVASHLGGTRNGLVVSWPARLKATGEVRTQYHHVIDVMPTILEAVGVRPPDSVQGVPQQRVDGVSMLYSFDAARAPDRRTTQYYEMLGNRALYHEGWLAGTRPRRMPWDGRDMKEPPETGYQWELYDLARDFSQSRDLAAKQPDRLRQMQALWQQEAERNHVLPLNDAMNPARGAIARTHYGAGRTSFTYWGADVRVSHDAAPPIAGRSFTVTADIVVPAAGAQGVLLAYGSHFGGWSFYLDGGRPVAYHAQTQQPGDQTRIAATEPLPPGPATVSFAFASEGPPDRAGVMTVRVGAVQVAQGRIGRTIILPAGLGETFDIGADSGARVTDAYAGDGRFTGELRKVQVDVGPPPAPGGLARP